MLVMLQYTREDTKMLVMLRYAHEDTKMLVMVWYARNCLRNVDLHSPQGGLRTSTIKKTILDLLPLDDSIEKRNEFMKRLNILFSEGSHDTTDTMGHITPWTTYNRDLM